MKTFHEFVWLRMPLEQLLRETSELFPSRSFQDLVDREVQRLREKTDDPAALAHLDEFQAINVPAYISSTARRAGVAPSDIDPVVSDIISKILLSNFFRGWSGQSLVARFKVTVRNAISTLRSRAAKRRRRQGDLPDDVAAAPRPDESIIGDFTNFLRARFGEEVVRVFRHRLEGHGNTKDLAGTVGSAFRVKQLVSQLRQAIRIYAAGDPLLSRRLDTLFAQQQRTYERRRLGRLAGASGHG